MSRKQVAAATLIAVSLLFPRRAEAEGGLWEFLESLSGPGPFYGFVLDAPVACRVVTVGKEPPEPPTIVYGEQCLTGRLLPKDMRVLANQGKYSWQRRWSIGLTVARFGTTKNNLEYADPSRAVGVTWLKVGPRATWHTRYFDLHSSIDFNQLSSKDRSANNFEDIRFATVEVVGLTYRPFPGVSSFWRHVTFSVKPQLLTKSLDASMFGAQPRKLEGAGHLHWQGGIHVDFWRY